MSAKPALKSVDAVSPAPEPKKSKTPLIVAVTAVICIAAGGAAWHFLGPKGAEHKEAVEKVKTPPVYVPLELFTVNLQGESDHYLQIGLTLQVADDKVVDEVKQHMPLIRNRLLLLFSSKTPEELGTLEGKQKLAAQVLIDARRQIDGKSDARKDKSDAHDGKAGEQAEKPEEHRIQDVLFSSLVIQ